MAIQHRRGIYAQFDPSKLVPGEWAVVLSGDPYASDGRAGYMCYAAGIVKRVATYEDMQDFFASVRLETVDKLVSDATDGIKSECAELMGGASRAEAERAEAERARAESEASRTSSEKARADAEAERSSSESARKATIEEFEKKVADGFFDGATFVPSVGEDGYISWTNDKGLDNPASVDIRGPKGADGVVTSLASGMYMLQVEGTDLMLVYGDESNPPDLFIEDGCLMLEIGE